MYDTISAFELIQNYENNGLFARIIDTPANEAVRSDFLIQCQDQRAARHLEESLEPLDLSEKFFLGISQARLLGGAIGVMLITDGGGIETPISPRAVAVEHIQIFDSSLVRPIFTEDPATPEFFRVESRLGCFTVHESRCLIFRHNEQPERTRTPAEYWGIPEYSRIAEAVEKTDTTYRTAAQLLERAVQPVYKMHNLSAMMATEEGENTVLRMLALLDEYRGLQNTVVIDMLDSYDFYRANLENVSDAVKACYGMVCAASGIPYSVLFGDYHVKNIFTDKGPRIRQEVYYNMVEGIQERMIRPNLLKLCRIIAPDTKPEIRFSSLWSESQLEKAEGELSRAKATYLKAKTDFIYVNSRILTPKDIQRRVGQFFAML